MRLVRFGPRGSEKPGLIDTQGFERKQGDPAMPPVRRVKTAAKKRGGDQGRTCPVPRTSHL